MLKRCLGAFVALAFGLSAAAARLAAFRAEGAHFRGLSFPTIAGSGPHGAIVHYRSTPASNRVLQPGDLFLLDSGAQYLDGTTDITRTVAICPAGAEERHRFPLVLKGHVGVSRALFPVGTTGSQLDVLARQHLWRHGLDYDHGTGHGVGSFLSVHEGPQRISKMGAGAVALKPGMVLSNEPGYYKSGAYGIRTENLVAVIPAEAPAGAEREMLEFDTLTLAPYDRTLIDPALLDAGERDWLNTYHARVLAALAPLLDDAARVWLERACAVICSSAQQVGRLDCPAPGAGLRRLGRARNGRRISADLLADMIIRRVRPSGRIAP